MRITEGLHTYGARLHAQKPKQSKSHDDISDSTIFEFVYHLNYYAENLWQPNLELSAMATWFKWRQST